MPLPEVFRQRLSEKLREVLRVVHGLRFLPQGYCI